MYEPRYWEFRSEEVRALAAEFTDPQAKDLILRIADDYLKLAGLVRNLPARDIPEAQSGRRQGPAPGHRSEPGGQGRAPGVTVNSPPLAKP